MAAVIVIVVALALLGACARLFIGEPAPAVRNAALIGGAAGFVLATVLGFALADGGLNAIALGLLGAAVLPLVLLGQMRLVRMLTGGR